MYNTAKKQVWYGELRTARGNAIVVHDNQLPEASPGRIYLFNSQRNAIIEYVEDIVKPNLHDLGEDEAKLPSVSSVVHSKRSAASLCKSSRPESI